MKPAHLVIPAALLLAPASASACINGDVVQSILIGLGVLLAGVVLTVIAQSGLLHLRRRHRLSLLGRITMAGLSSLHLILGLSVVGLALTGGPIAGVVGLLLAVPFFLLSWKGLRPSP